MGLKKSYQWDAKDYASHSQAQQGWAQELLSRLQLVGNESLLDIGCGDGKVTAEIACFLKEGKVVGIDTSEEMLALAKDKYPQSSYPNVSFHKEDACTMSFSEEFDVIFSNAALHWVIDHKPVLHGIHQSLKPGGRVIVQMGGKGNASQVVNVIDDVMKREQWQEYFENFIFPYGFYSPDEYAPWLRDAGFEIISLELKPKDMIHQSQEEFAGWFRTTWLPYIHQIPEPLRNEFIDLVVDEYCQTARDKDGRINTLMQRLEFVAAK